MAARLTVVIPTLGRSPWLIPCLKAIQEDDPSTEVVVIDQGDAATDLPEGLADRVLRPGRNLGFAAATNLGIAESARDFVATINDDAVIEPGWTARLVEALDRDPGAGAVQGVNLRMDSVSLADGCGITWNRWTQAVQIGHGKPAPLPSEPSREVFGVSATAAIYRREALEAAGLFDPRLISYYEDVDLAARLHSSGWSAVVVPAARARHAGSATGETLSRERWRLIYGNRWLVAARTFGRSFWLRVP
ncbi:MAG TPA: glycosyltransferase family 2 protein, partial [Thermoanaerobaculia bacterium]|nr:glycosyltransferase family 2 protein [Thermoanaerobaculia bacterium]